MIALIERASTIGVDGDYEELDQISKDMMFEHPERWRIDKYIQWKLTKGKKGWDGFIRPLRRYAGAWECMRGYKDELIAAIKERDFELDGSRLIKSPFRALTSADLPDDLIKASFQLDEGQRQCVAAWLANGMGVATVTVAGGKTAMFAAVASYIKRHYPKARFLYLTPTERLVRQSFKVMQEFLPDWSISKYGGGSDDKSGADMIVATLAMMFRNFEELVQEEFFDSFMGILFDESQHACSKSAEQILLAIPAYFRLGASDSRKEMKLMEQWKIRGLLGPFRNVVEASALIKVGRIARPHIYVIDNREWRGKFSRVSHQAAPGSRAFALLAERGIVEGIYLGPVYATDEEGQVVYRTLKQLRGAKFVKVEEPVTVPGQHLIRLDGLDMAVESRYCILERMYDRAITRFNARNRLIAEWVKHFTDKGWQTLVVATRTMHVLILETIISEIIEPDKVKILFGQSSPKERDEVFEWFMATPGSVLISPLVKEGVNLPELKAGVVADYVGDFEYLNQIIGRFMRKKRDDNHAHIAVFVDRQHRRLAAGCYRLWDKLQHKAGYYMYYPLVHPEDLAGARLYDTEALVEADRRIRGKS